MRHLRIAVLMLALLGPAALGQAADQDPLVRARVLYNQAAYEEAIAAAMEALKSPADANAALLVLGRARLERFRSSNDRGDLAAGRDDLMRVNPLALTPRERVELELGLAEALYLEQAYGAAAEVLDALLPRVHLVGAHAGERVLDWWATTIDRAAQTRPPAERAALYGWIIDRMEAELRRDPGSAPAAYWLAAAARGAGDIERAWDAAVAGWVRAPFTQDRGAALRADLDRLVLQALVPERARHMATAQRDADTAAAALAAEWALIKERWSHR